jgi:CheY-like chemotaxis protein
MSEDQIVVLVAGDDPSDLNNLSVYLRSEGYSTVTVLNRATIVAIARSERPNLIFNDSPFRMT